MYGTGMVDIVVWNRNGRHCCMEPGMVDIVVWNRNGRHCCMEQEW